MANTKVASRCGRCKELVGKSIPMGDESKVFADYDRERCGRSGEKVTCRDCGTKFLVEDSDTKPVAKVFLWKEEYD